MSIFELRIIGKFFGIVVLTWLCMAAAAEAVFRLVGDAPTHDLEGLYAPFVDGNYKLATNVDTEADWASGKLTVHTDDLGLRCDSDRQFATRPGQSVDVLLLGDSQGFGNGVSFESSLAGSLAITAKRDGFDVRNASIGGHSAASQARLAQWLNDEHGLKVANYVILVTPAIASSGGHLNRARVGADGRLYGEATGTLALLRLWIKTHLVVYGRIRDAAHNASIGVVPENDAPFVFQFYQTGQSEELLSRKFLEFVGQFKAFAAQRGARVHLVYLPLTLEADFEPTKRAAALRGIDLDRDVPLRVCSAIAKQLNLTFFSLRPLLESLHAKGTALQLGADFHYAKELSVNSGENIWEALKPAITQSAASGQPLLSNGAK